MKHRLTTQQILELIAKGRIKSSEGFRLYKDLQHRQKSRNASLTKDVDSFSTMYFHPVWDKSEPATEKREPQNRISGCIMIFDTNEALRDVLAEQQEMKRGKDDDIKIILVKAGTKFRQTGSHTYEIDPTRQDDYNQLLQSLKKQELLPDQLIHLWSTDVGTTAETALYRGVYSIYYLINAYSKLEIELFKRLLFILNEDKDSPNPYMECTAAYSRSLENVYPRLLFSTIRVAGSPNKSPGVTVDVLVDVIRRELSMVEPSTPYEVHYDQGERYIKKLKSLEIQPVTRSRSLLKKGGVYLITGGCGGLGFILARYLAEKYHATLILTGRSESDEKRKKKIEKLKDMASGVSYFKADAADKKAMEHVIAKIKQEYGVLNGIIHSAGAANEKLIIRKNMSEFQESIKPKIHGTIILDRVTEKEDLDFFAIFSSLSSILGDFGQCDYAVANRFIDDFAGLRNNLTRKHLRRGRTISINWPLWREGGMHTGKEAESLYLKSSGMAYLETTAGLEAFENILNSGHDRVMVLNADKKRIDRFLSVYAEGKREGKSFAVNKKNDKGISPGTIPADEFPAGPQSPPEELVQADLKNMASALIKLDPQKMNVSDNLGNYGFDSITLKDFANKLSKTYNIDISPTVFFQQGNIQRLSEYLLEEFQPEIRKYYFEAETEPVPGFGAGIEKQEITAVVETVVPGDESSLHLSPSPAGKKEKEDIAIIGAGSILPGSRDHEEFWQNLVAGKDLITEIPGERWNWQDYYSETSTESDKAISKWGGFISGVDKFDALFFNISPREARLMDPQQRLLLETVWKTIEDAGYRVSEFAGRPVGVFIGAESNDYGHLLKESGESGAQIITGNHHAVLSNRISFLLNLRGASETINTGCSSSLVAVNQAVRAIQNRDCQLAIAGGVSLMISPEGMVTESKMGILSPDGRCKTFDRRANGYVRGEGLGTILLKPLAKAVADHDHIYAVIKGTAINHGGKANSFTAPNSAAQSELLISAYEEAGLDPGTVTYIEAHGTGTELGDPVEVDGIKHAFKTLAEKHKTTIDRYHYCGLGAVKTNIGHLEAASGIAGIIKVILAIKHKILPATLHLQELNPYIDLNNTPFYVVDQTKPWAQLTCQDGNKIPRRAGVSSFGFGGTNVHVVLEEYEGPAPQRNPRHQERQIVVLSAKNEERLKEYAGNMLDFLEKNNSPGSSSSIVMKQSIVPNFKQEIQQYMLKTVSMILKVDVNNLHTDEDMTEYGFEPGHISELVNRLHEKYNIEIPAAIFFSPEDFSINALAEYLCSEYAGSVRDNLLDNCNSSTITPSSSITNTQPCSFHLPDIAYTLQRGREHMNERLALIVSTIGELKEKLSRYCRSGEESDIKDFYKGNVNNGKQIPDRLFKGKAGGEFIRNLVNDRDISGLAQLWVSGVDIDWQILYSSQLPYRLSLPTYPFAGQRYWISGLPGKHVHTPHRYNYKEKNRLHPLIDSIEPGPSLELSNGLVFQKTLRKSDPVIKDHQVTGRYILPGVAYLEMAHAALSRACSAGNVKISGVVWLHPLAVQDEAKKISIVIKKDNGRFRFEIQGRKDNQAVIHGKGEIQPDETPGKNKEQRVSIEQVKTRCSRKMDIEKLYAGYRQIGINYGPYFRGLSRLWMNDEEALGLLELPSEYTAELAQYTLHPTLLDSALQTTAGLAPGYPNNRSSKPMLPFSVETVEILHPLTAKGYAYARKSGKTSYNVAILDESGRVCIKLHDVNARELKTKESTLKSSQSKELMDHFLFKPRWIPAPLPEAPLDTPETDAIDKKTGTILVIYPPQSPGIEELLESAYSHQKNRVIKVKLGTETRQISQNDWEIDTKAPHTFDTIITPLEQLQCIYFLGGLEVEELNINHLDTDMFEESQQRGIFSLFGLVKSLIDQNHTQYPLQINVITNNTHQVVPGETIRPYAATLHGFIRSTAKEFSQWEIHCLDISLEGSGKGKSRETLKSLVKAIITETTLPCEETVALREGRRYIRKIEPLALPMNSVDKTPFRQKGVYLVLGGAGGIGLELSRYLAETIQARLILLGRSELKENQKEKISQIEAMGGEVLYLQVDATHLENMQSAIAEAKSRFGQINGVVHSAIVLKDRTLENMDEETLQAALAPKVKGSFVLYNVLKDEPLDFMIFFSSAMSFTCNAGQSNYAAACTFKDAFAHYINRYTPYPVKIINWGYWGSVGIVASQEYNQRLASRGIYSITPGEGMETLERVLGHRVDQVIPFKAQTDILEKMGIDMHYCLELYPEAIPSLVKAVILDMQSNPLLTGTAGMDAFSDKKTSIALEEFMHHLLLKFFRQMGVFQKADETYNIDRLYQQLEIIPNYYRLVGALLDILSRAGFIQVNAKQVQACPKLETSGVQETINALEQQKNRLMEDFPGIAAHIKLLWICLNAYPRVLTGQKTHMEVLFPNGSMELVSPIYQGNKLKDYYNLLVAQIIKTYIQLKLKIEPQALINILEVGAGTGGTSSFVLDAVRECGEQIRYIYSDISIKFIQHGKNHFQTRYPFVDFQVLDIEKPPREQNIQGNSIDIVFATDVVHATKRVDNTLQQLKKVLKTNGLLILNEATRNHDFGTLTFGLTDGWWLFEDEANRIKGSPLLSPAKWLQVLEINGFRNVRIQGPRTTAPEDAVQNVIIGESNGEVITVPGKEHETGEKPGKPMETRPPSIKEPAIPEWKSSLTKSDDLKQYIEDMIIDYVAGAVGMSPDKIEAEKQFSDYGVDSIVAVELVNQMNKQLGIVLKTITFFDYPNVKDLCNFIYKTHGKKIAGILQIGDAGAKTGTKMEIPEENLSTSTADTDTNIDPGTGTSPGEDIFYREKEIDRTEPGEDVFSQFPYRALILTGPGKIENLRLAPIQPGKPTDHEVQIGVKAFSLNFGDLLCVQGLYPNMPEYPFTPGSEVSGTVLKTGRKANKVMPGDEVIGLTGPRMGGHSSIVTTHEQLVVEKPGNISHEEACAFPAAFLTMHHVFETARVEKGEKILVQTAAGGTGLIAVQLARLKGAEIFATAGSQKKLDYLEKMGVHHVINYRTEDFAQRVLEITSNQGVDVVINTLSGDAIQKGIDILAPCGRYLEIAMTGLRTSDNLNLSGMVDNQIFYGIDLRRLLEKQPDKIKKYLETMVRYLKDGSVKPTVGQVFPFSHIREAYQCMQDRGNIGKIVVTIPPPQSPTAPKEQEKKEKVTTSKDIAIIGISGRFPGAKNVEEFWKNLSTGKNSITMGPGERWHTPENDDQGLQNNDRKCQWGGFLEDIDLFDSQFFDIPGNEAERTDPQQRLFLEESWKALEDAGYSADSVSDTTMGVFVGASTGDYLNLLKKAEVYMEASAFLGNALPLIPARISYFFNLKGPALVVDTACSSSLSAIHLARLSILSGDCHLAIAGGICIFNSPNFHILANNANMLSPSGNCKTFDDHADGFVPAEGVGVVILKLMETAREDGDHIYGIIKGSGVNQDGKTMGITAPSSRSQSNLLSTVYNQAKINPGNITYVEAHGTGTKLGDTIEIEALTNAFNQYSTGKQYCAVGSVKTNIGHAVQAAGVTSVIKVLLALKNKQIPPSLHFETPNKYINFKQSPFYVNTELKDWSTGSTPRQAAVSAFGFNGTNAHMVIEEAPIPGINPIHLQAPFYLIPFSARTEQALERKYKDLLKWLENETGESIGNIAYTLTVGRSHFPLRSAIIVKSCDQLKQELEALCQQEKTGNNLINPRQTSKTGKKSDLIEQGNQLTAEIQQGHIGSEDEFKKRLTALGGLFINGYDPDWTVFYKEKGYRRISLPTYPFAKEKYWVPGSEDHSPEESVPLGDNEIRVLIQNLESGKITFAEANLLTEGKL